jgi:glutathione-independent formaldehyde dehydrogenase
VPWGKFFNKNIYVRMGRDDDKRWNRKLRDMIITDAATPSQVISHHFPLEAAPGAYAKFDAREDGYIKVVLRPKSVA